MKNYLKLFRLGLLSLFIGVSLTAQAADILFYGPSIRVAVPNEATIAAGLGHTVTVDDAVAWAARATASFASFDALVIGDRDCVTDTVPLATAEATAATWGAAVGGNVVSYGYDPTFADGSHGEPEATVLIENAINFAASGGRTGLVMALGCYYVLSPVGTPVVSLGGLGLGPFLVSGQVPLGTCDGVSFDDPGHPVLAGLTPAGIGDTGCSVHAVFDVPLPDGCESIARSTEADQPWIVVCEEVIIEVDIDIKFCSNPNAHNCKSGGSLPVTIFGSDDLDVTLIDLATLQLCNSATGDCTPAGATAKPAADRGSPGDEGTEECERIDTDGDGVPDLDVANPDGFDDLDVAFDKRAVSDLLTICDDLGMKGDLSEPLVIQGSLLDGTPILSNPEDEEGVDILQRQNR